MTTKVDLFKAWLSTDYWNDYVWDCWFEWRLQQAGIPRHNRERSDEEREQWTSIMRSIPHHWNWRINHGEGVMIFTWEDGSETVPLTEFYSDEDEQPDLEMLWHSNYYDGPLSGMARYNGEDVWFSLEDEDELTGDRTFALYRLSVEHRDELFRRHDVFRELVGHHCDHHPDRHSPFRERNLETGRSYYELAKTWDAIDATQGEKIAEVHWFQFKYWQRPV